jgi:hypothetical protein
MHIQYLGYESISDARTYSFRVIDSLKNEREFTVKIVNQTLLDNHFKCQDVPDLCFAKLKSELASETQDQLLPSQMMVSNADFRKYIEDHYPARHRPPKPW